MTLNEITYEIRGAKYDVYKDLGPGLLESVYEEALAFELEQRGLKIERQKQVPIIYKGNVLKTELRLDLWNSQCLCVSFFCDFRDFCVTQEIRDSCSSV